MQKLESKRNCDECISAYSMVEKPGVVIESVSGSDANWLGTARSLGRNGIEVIRLSPYPWYASKYCKTILSPDIRKDPHSYLKFLITTGKYLLRKFHHKYLLLPSSDNGLILLSRNKEKLSNYYVPVVPDWKSVEKIIDKSKTYQFAKSMGILVPETYDIKDLAMIDEIAKNINYPFLIKPAHSHMFGHRFGMKLYKAYSKDDFVRICRFFFHQSLKILIQEEIPGGDDQIYMFTACFNQDSEPLAFITSKKIRQNPPNFGNGSFVQSVCQPEITDIGMKVLKKLNFYGVAMIEFKKDPRTGNFYLLEINGRSHTQNYLATECGKNLPYILYEDIIGKKQEPLGNYYCDFKVGIKWIHLTLDIITMLKKRNKGEITLGDWLRSIIGGKKNYAILSADDFNPFISEIKTSLMSIIERDSVIHTHF